MTSRQATHTPLLIAAGAGVGVVLRYMLGAWSEQHLPGFPPAGTFMVNLLGCLVIGIVQHLFPDGGPLKRPAQLLLVVGFCGAFTTFSTFSVETLRLIDHDQLGLALGYQICSVVLGFVAVIAGSSIAALGVRLLRRDDWTP